MKKNCNLTPFYWCMLESFPFIENVFHEIDNYHLLCRIVEYVNKIGNKTNELGLKVQELNNWFNSLDVQDEVNKKLDEMALNGTLSEIINEDIFNELNNKVNENTEKLSKLTKYPNFFIGAFFSGRFGSVGDATKHHFVCSLNGTDFTEFNTNNNIGELSDRYLGNMCLQFDKNKKRFLLSVTDYTQNYDCLIFTSTDFINWEKHEINLGYLVPHNDLNRWTPNLLVTKNGEIYLILSVEYERVDTTKKFEQILFKCVDKENLSFSKIGTIKLSDTYDNYIDGSIVEYNNNFFLSVKVEPTGIIQIYSSYDIENLNSYGLLNEYVNFENLPLEAPCLCFTENVCNLYAENFSRWHGYTMQQCRNIEFPNFPKSSKWIDSLTNKVTTTSPEKYDMRGGNIIYITDDDAKEIILNNTDINFTETNAIKIDDKEIDFEFLWGKTPNYAIVYPNCKYAFYNSTGTIEIDNLINPYNCDQVKFVQSQYALTIKINKINGTEVNINYQNNGSSKGGISILDLNTGRFTQPSTVISLASGIIENELSTIAKLGLCYAINYNGTVYTDFRIDVTTTPSNQVITIGKLPDGFRPRWVCNAVHSSLADNSIVIENNGEIKANLNSASVGQQIRCSACFVPIN